VQITELPPGRPETTTHAIYGDKKGRQAVYKVGNDVTMVDVRDVILDACCKVQRFVLKLLNQNMVRVSEWEL
jgi:hypothetical protein